MRSAMVLVMVLSGIALGVQLVLNSRLREAVHSPVFSAVVSFTIGGALLAVLMSAGLFGGTGRGLSGLRGLPWWAFLGGVCGAVYVVASVVALPRIGAATTVCATVLGQQVISLVFDTFGWLGGPRTPLTPGRVLGTALLFAGVVLMQRK